MKTYMCLKCGKILKHYDFVPRGVRMKNRHVNIIKVERLRCPVCKHVRRILPNYLYPNKQYSATIIDGVLNGGITNDILEYEDYPCESTMRRWMNEFH